MGADSSSATTDGHLVFARRYRPQKFGEVIEQQTAVQALQKAIHNKRLGSAYLFFGPRGIGKTTIARILAKCINCQDPQNDEPCDRCNSCEAILSGNSMDVIEIDAASHRGIDHIRELRENVKFPPMVSHYKVYIIDEVHMLTMESFNALLKTLEEPPSHALFVLATTELNKIPETILSRCQVFNFRKVPLRILQDYLKELLSREGITADEEALFWIARRGDGSVRDSLSFLEQAVTYCDAHLETAKVRELTGIMPAEIFQNLLDAILNADADRKALLAPVHEIFVAGGDLQRFIWDFLEYLRTLTHILQGVSDPEFLGLPGQEAHRLKERYHAVDPNRLSFMFNKVYDLLGRAHALRLRNSFEMRVLIEMELLAMREELGRPSLSTVLARLNQLGAAMQSGTPYSPEHELQKQFLGTVVEGEDVPQLEV